jgi:hypothetical protein
MRLGYFVMRILDLHMALISHDKGANGGLVQEQMTLTEWLSVVAAALAGAAECDGPEGLSEVFAPNGKPVSITFISGLVAGRRTVTQTSGFLSRSIGFSYSRAGHLDSVNDLTSTSVFGALSIAGDAFAGGV